ncbi:MAG: alpha/beta hydrolase [Candidatus Promineifilaceae bacterium]
MFKVSAEIPTNKHPYKLNGGRIGVLVLHGFMGSPGSSRPLATFLNNQGLTVHCPLLEGHGHLPERLHRISHRQWLKQAENAFESLREQCDKLFIIAHSMGCILAAHLVRRYDDVQGLVMVAPLYRVPNKSIYLMRYLRPFISFLYPVKMKLVPRHLIEKRVLDFDPTIDVNDPEVREWMEWGVRLPTSGLDEMLKMTRRGKKLWKRIHVPTLLLQGDQDEAIDPNFANRIFGRIKHPDKNILHIPTGRHELIRPADPNHAEAWQHIYSFISARSEI